jgi:hypothetical protein
MGASEDLQRKARFFWARETRPKKCARMWELCLAKALVEGLD